MYSALCKVDEAKGAEEDEDELSYDRKKLEHDKRDSGRCSVGCSDAGIDGAECRHAKGRMTKEKAQIQNLWIRECTYGLQLKGSDERSWREAP